MENKVLRVDVNASETNTTYHSITKAINSIEKDSKNHVIIEIMPGVYHERVEVWRDDVTLVGMGRPDAEDKTASGSAAEHSSQAAVDPEQAARPSAAQTVITMSYGAADIMEDGSKRGTFRSYTVLVAADRVTLKNLTIANDCGDPVVHGQGIALYADGDDINVIGCRLTGRQDTLFTGPLPPKEIKPGGFIGPLQNAPRIVGRQYYTDCYICGDVDFIFGSAAATFKNCTIVSVPHRPKKADTDMIQGYVTAPSSPEGEERGYIFEDCDFLSEGLLPGTAYLSRPWRNFAKAAFIRCRIGDHIRKEGFHDWDKTEARKTVRYEVIDCRRTDGSVFDPHPW